MLELEMLWIKQDPERILALVSPRLLPVFMLLDIPGLKMDTCGGSSAPLLVLALTVWTNSLFSNIQLFQAQ